MELGSGTRSVEGRRPVCLGSRPMGAAVATARICGPGDCRTIPRHAKPIRGDAGRAASRRRREPRSGSPASSLAALPGAAKVPTERPSLGLSDRKQVSCKITLAREFPRNFHGNNSRPSCYRKRTLNGKERPDAVSRKRSAPLRCGRPIFESVRPTPGGARCRSQPRTRLHPQLLEAGIRGG